MIFSVTGINNKTDLLTTQPLDSGGLMQAGVTMLGDKRKLLVGIAELVAASGEQRQRGRGEDGK